MLNKQKMNLMYSRRKVITRNYYDRVNEDMSNKSFFIYDLGKYNNKNLYYYGETMDITQTEFILKKTLPLYKIIYSAPVDANIDGYNKFNKLIKDHKSKLPLKNCSSWDIFQTENIDYILDAINVIFNNYEHL